MKTIIAATALALMSGAALAQTATPSTPPATTPQTTVPAPAPAPTTARAPSASINAAVMTSLPSGSTTVTNWYKQNVYGSDGSSSVGQVKDVLLSPDGKVAALIVGVGGFLGMGDHDVAVPFEQIKHTIRDGKAMLTMDSSKDDLKSAPGLRYDSATTTWVPEGR